MWGLVLSGGGGKGAYEAGVLRALAETGFLAKIAAISGSSVGGLNAALAGMEDMELLKKCWMGVSPGQLLSPDENSPAAAAQVRPGDSFFENTRRQLLAEGLFSKEGLQDLILRYLDFSVIASCRFRIFVSLTCAGQNTESAPMPSSPLQNTLEREAVSTFGNGGFCVDLTRLSAVSPETAADVLLATSAMPYVYDPVQIQGHWYRDGGIAENTPLSPMRAAGIRRIIVVRLSENPDPLTVHEKQGFDEILELHPSSYIGSFLDGTVSFEPERIRFRDALGYRDTLRVLQYKEMEAKGYTPAPEERAAREKSDAEAARSSARIEQLTSGMEERIRMLNSLLEEP